MHSASERWLAYLKVSALAGVLGLLLYWGTLHWLGREFALAALDVTRDQAEVTADRLERVLPAAGLQNSLNGLTRATEQQIADLVRGNPNIILLLIADGRGRVIPPVLGNTPAGAKLWHDLTGGKLLRGLDANSLVKAIREALPNETVEVNRSIGPPERAKGKLVLFVDPSTPQELVARAKKHMARDLIPLLVAGLIMCGLILWLLARQRRVAERLRAQRDQAESLAHVGTLAAGLAHEIRNPVNALAMQLEMLEEDAEAGAQEQLSKRVERIRAGLANLERTVHEFLNYAMPERQSPAGLDLAAELQAIVALENRGELTGGAAPEITLKVPAGLSAWCDAHAFRQIVANLFTNALRCQREANQPQVLIEAYRERGAVIIALEDAGPGVAAEHRQQIFEAFFTTRPDGTGLGLPIARRLALMNRGELSLSAKGTKLGGARFELKLPANPTERNA